MHFHSRGFLDGELDPSGVQTIVHTTVHWRRQVDGVELDPVELVMHHRSRGQSIRQIAYLTGIPQSTVGDIVKEHTPPLPEPSPFSKLERERDSA